MDDVLSNLRFLLRVDPEDLTEGQAKEIWAGLGIIDSKKRQGQYEAGAPYRFLFDAFDLVAKVLVNAHTPDDKIGGLVLNIVVGFSDHNRWMHAHLALARDVLIPKVSEWRHQRDLKAIEVNVSEAGSKNSDKPPSIAEQVESLRNEADVTQEKLAELIGIDVRNVQRHLAGATPQSRTLARYERVFSKLMNRQVVIKKTS
jgi:hypothetical protein